MGGSFSPLVTYFLQQVVTSCHGPARSPEPGVCGEHHVRPRAGPGLGELDRTRGYGEWAVGAVSPCVSQERKGEWVLPDGVGGAWGVRPGPGRSRHLEQTRLMTGRTGEV